MPEKEYMMFLRKFFVHVKLSLFVSVVGRLSYSQKVENCFRNFLKSL